MTCFLPNYFEFQTARDLVRVGRERDGGYLVSESDIRNTDHLVSLGLGDDLSFENDFLDRKSVEVSVFDSSVSLGLYLTRLFESVFHLHKPRRAPHFLLVAIRYIQFFRRDRTRHLMRLVGFDSTDGEFISLRRLLDDVNGNYIFMKIDVEGSEYRMLTDLVEFQSRLSGLVVEFHDCDIHLEEIKNFMKQLELKLVHIHANNACPVRQENLLPLVLEFTFSRFADLDNHIELPHQLDRPNDPSKPDAQLRFSPP